MTDQLIQPTLIDAMGDNLNVHPGGRWVELSTWFNGQVPGDGSIAYLTPTQARQLSAQLLDAATQIEAQQ